MAVSTEFGPTIGRSGDSAVSDGTCSGLAVNSERAWSGWQLTTAPPLIPALQLEHLAELAAGAEDELDLALAEAQRLQRPGKCDLRRRVERVTGIRRARGRRWRLTDVERFAAVRAHPPLPGPLMIKNQKVKTSAQIAAVIAKIRPSTPVR